ncbi:hypothetical protein FEM21_06880 [Flavobacterium seoulense]|uniref:Uncharacterized protein n=1 Tax=Flavobacterium seoulense TaxID=1492738 RepID=A0A066WQL2_9FLAO|nr:hypothetical protein FEM21_06880 [Flavobacterium seoulense]
MVLLITKKGLNKKVAGIMTSQKNRIKKEILRSEEKLK